ncbi:Hypothetical predicted protein [Mytilus galloprovincialis]|uniref:Fibronectin type-III domain-containing protein n=1 Tax=Mytilus galloprovincialis TaxID=29158 RepID=A0A8B6DMW7_MYTGA|nr:Hypothetical predicted protein [Mytilus galloprovincialis]
MDILILLTVLQMVSLIGAYEFTCPSQAHWNLRAKSLCKATTNYTCLFDINLQINVYRDRCNRPRILGPGYKYVFQPNLNRAACNGNRYQPFIFETVGYSDCNYQKSLCNSQGQETYEHGDTRVDRKCICNTDRGYNFVRNLNNQCYCNPSNEDCSCYFGINPYNKTLQLRAIKCYDDKQITRSSSLDMLNNSRTITINKFSNYKYNLNNFPTNEHRIEAAISVLTLILSFFAVCISVDRIITRWTRIHNYYTPSGFEVVECSDCSITIAWDKNVQDNCLGYELRHRVPGPDNWEVTKFSTTDVSSDKSGRCMYTLLNISPDTGYEIKLCSVDSNGNSQFTESKTKQTLKREIKKQNMDNHIAAIKDGMEFRRFVRIQVIGKEGVGKSSLVRRLVGDSNMNVNSTDGIDIVSKCKIRTTDGELVIGEVETERKKIMRRIQEAVRKEPKQSEPVDGQVNQCEGGNNEQEAIVSNNSLSKDERKQEYESPTQDTIRKASPGLKTMEKSLTGENKVNIDDNVTIVEEKFKIDIPNKIDGVLSKDTKNAEDLVKIDDMRKKITEQMDKILLEIQKDKDKMTSESLVECGLWDFAGQKEYYATHQTFLNPHAIYLLVTNISEDIAAEHETDFDSIEGQKDYYATHQTFLNPHAIYLLVTNISDDLTTKGDETDFDSIEEYIDFWFDSIHCLSTISSEKKTNIPEGYPKNRLYPPVIVVCTHIDEHKGKIEKMKEAYLNKFKEIFGGHDKANHNRGIYFVSNREFLASDFKKLKDKIYEVAKETNFFEEELPTQWIQLENALSVLKHESKQKILSFQKIVELSQITFIKEEDILPFLTYQHKIGNIIFFEDIQKYIILQPEWLVKCFRCLVCDDHQLKRNHEILNSDDWPHMEKTGQLSDDMIDRLFEKEPEYKVCEKAGQKTLYRGKTLVNWIKTGLRKLCICFSKNAIALQVWTLSDVDDNINRTILEELCKKIEELKERLRQSISYDIKAKCSNGDYSNTEGRMTYKDLGEVCERGHYWCPEHKELHSKDDVEKTWLQYADIVTAKVNKEHDERNTRISSENEPNKEDVQDQTSVKTNLSVSVTLRQQINIKKSTNKYLSITSCIKTGNTLVFTDSFNNLIICNSDGTDIHYIPLSYKPGYITEIDSNTVAVSCVFDRTILIINISTRSVTSTINTRGDCWGISYNDNNLYVVIDGSIIDVMDLTGKVIRTIPVPGDNLLGISDITVDRDRLVCIDDRRSIYCCSLEGKEMWKFKKDEIENLRGVTTDNEGNVYVIDYIKDTVIVVSDDGKHHRKLVTKSDGLDWPWGIYFDKKENIMLMEIQKMSQRRNVVLLNSTCSLTETTKCGNI